MPAARSRFSAGCGLVLVGLACLGSCSKEPLSDGSVPASCDFALPKRCDICATGETVCAHYVVRDGMCMAETCPPAPSPPDASAPVEDARTDSSEVTQIGPSYACGPADGGLRCSCGLDPFFPAPIDDAGQQQTFVLAPDPATVVAYHTMAEFDALAVGRWRRTAGQGELICEQYGIDLTADHRLIPLVIASDGSVQAVTAQATPFSISFDGAGSPNGLGSPGLQTNAPIFFDGGRSMYLLYAPWPADYVRMP